MKLVKSAKGPDPKQLVSYHLHKAAHGVREGRSLRNIHASDMTRDDWCARRHALLLSSDTPPPDEHLHTAQALAFEGSSAMARIVVRWATLAGIAVGDWKCLYCSHPYEYTLRPAQCEECEGDSFWYEEHRFRSEVSGGSGGIDLIVRLSGLERDRIVEIKALDKQAFKDTKMPHAEHRLRTNLYMRFVEESCDPFRGNVDTETATVLYMTKGGYGEKTTAPKDWGLTNDAGWSPFKEFLVKRDDTATEAMCSAAEQLKLFQEDAGPLPSGICPSPFGSIAQRCPVRQACFGS